MPTAHMLAMFTPALISPWELLILGGVLLVGVIAVVIVVFREKR